ASPCRCAHASRPAVDRAAHCAQGPHVPARRGAVVGRRTHPLPQRNASQRRQSAASARPTRRGVRHRVRRAGHGGARGAHCRQRAAREHRRHQRSRQLRAARHRNPRMSEPRATSATGRRALVTGGSGAIGGAVCRRLARDGHHVYVHSHRGVAVAEALVGEIRAGGGEATLVSCDLTDGAATRASLEAVLEQGPIQILVNNAGVHDDAVLPGMSATQWQRVIDVSVNGFFNATQPLLLPMIRTRWGRIVNVSSVAALIGNKGQVNYAAAKGALNSATKALALEVATRGITVNSVAPGIIGTPMTAGLFDAKAIERLVPMNRLGSPEEVAAVVSFLVSEEAAYVTAQVISVSGGMA